MRLPVHIWIRDENATPDELAGYFIVLAQRLDARPQKMRLVIESTVPASLDFDPSDGMPTVTVGDRTKKFNIRRRWIPEHPVPLPIGLHPSKRRRTVLLIDPVDGNRFRVRTRSGTATANWVYALLALVCTVAAITLHPFAIGAALVLFLSLMLARLLSLWYNSRLQKLIKEQDIRRREE